MTPGASPTPPNGDLDESRLKIYFLPNLLTAGNLFCGFVALTKIVEADPLSPHFSAQIKLALAFILLACIFDLFDGRVARMGGAESPFGREFDSLADLISFGAAPAFLVHRIVLKDVFIKYAEFGWFIASIYLICGAFRLARFNVFSAEGVGGGSKDFLGFPIPSAAGLVASLTLFMIWMTEIGWLEERFSQSRWRYVLPVLLLFLSWMMVSKVRYPSFKSLGFRATRTFTKTLVAVLFIGGVLILQEKLLYWALPLFFTSYLIYGFVRPHISRRIRKEIEEEEEDDDDPTSA